MCRMRWLAVGVLMAGSTARAQFGNAMGGQFAPMQAAQPPAEDAPRPKAAPSRVVAVTVYHGGAMVTREVATPEGKGTIELFVTPLPGETVAGSLSAVGVENIRVLSTRFRRRAIREDTRAAVRAKEAEIKVLAMEAKKTAGDIEVLKKNLGLLTKLEDFTGATLKNLAEKGQLDDSATVQLSRFVMDDRARKSSELVEAEQRLDANGEASAFAAKQLQELAAGTNKTENDAVIVVDKADPVAGSVRLEYLVGASTWKPQYRFRAGGPKDPVQVETLAAIEQRSGEDWVDAAITLSTAQPSLSATVPDLSALEFQIVEGDIAEAQRFGAANSPEQADMARNLAQQQVAGSNDAKAVGALLNQAAALEQAGELRAEGDVGAAETKLGPSITFALKGRLSVPSRNDAQLVEVSRGTLQAEYFAKAVPVFSPRVFRNARLVNTGEAVLLPGEASMYVGNDFVGRMTLPQVAVGEPFTVGFGVDPTLQIGRRLVKKSSTAQGGNQVQTYEFRLVARNFGPSPAKLEVWDRLPRPRTAEVAVNLVESAPPLSQDPLYNRAQRPENLLRWDLDVPANTTGEKALSIGYTFKIEYAKEAGIEYLTGSLAERPIGGMGGMGGGGMGGGFR